MVARFLFGNALEQELEEITSEEGYGYEIDYAAALDYSDKIKTKQYAAKEVCKSLKGRLEHLNPNVQIKAVKLADILVKNSGREFVTEIAKGEFIDALVVILNSSKTTSVELKDEILAVLESWAMAFKGDSALYYTVEVFEKLKRQGRVSNRRVHSVTNTIIQTPTAPAWVDSDYCMRCQTAFTFSNRKHHCRNCGKCYCNDCANNYIALPKFGINDQVRVCHGCYLVLTNVVREVLNSQPRDVINSQRGGDKTDKKLSDEDEDLKRAIELSLKDVKGPEVQVVKPKTPEKTTEEQEELDLKAAIEASLRDAKPSYMYNYSSTAVANHENTLKSPLTAYESEFYPKVPGSSGSSISDNFSVLDDFDIDIDTYTPQAKPQQKASDQLLTSSEMDDINLFRTLLSQIQYSGRDIRDNQQMQYLVEEIKKIKGKIRTEIVQNDTKIQEFLKLHDRILSAIKIYDQFLDQRLLPGQTYAYPSLGPKAPASTVPYNNYNPFAPNYQPQTTSFSSNINPNPVTLQPAQPTTHFAEGHQVHPVYPQQRDQQYQQPQQQQQQHIENTNNSITNQFSQPPPSSMGFAAANAPPSTSKDANISANSYHVQPQLTMDNQAPAETQNYPPPSHPHLQPQPQLQPQPHYPPINPAPEIKPMAPTYIQDQGKTPPFKDDSASVEEGDLIQF